MGLYFGPFLAVLLLSSALLCGLGVLNSTRDGAGRAPRGSGVDLFEPESFCFLLPKRPNNFHRPDFCFWGVSISSRRGSGTNRGCQSA